MFIGSILTKPIHYKGNIFCSPAKYNREIIFTHRTATQAYIYIPLLTDTQECNF